MVKCSGGCSEKCISTPIETTTPSDCIHYCAIRYTIDRSRLLSMVTHAPISLPHASNQQRSIRKECGK